MTRQRETGGHDAGWLTEPGGIKHEAGSREDVMLEIAKRLALKSVQHRIVVGRPLEELVSGGHRRPVT